MTGLLPYRCSVGFQFRDEQRPLVVVEGEAIRGFVVVYGMRACDMTQAAQMALDRANQAAREMIRGLGDEPYTPGSVVEIEITDILSRQVEEEIHTALKRGGKSEPGVFFQSGFAYFSE